MIVMSITMLMHPETTAQNSTVFQWSATTGPRTGAGPWRVRYRAVYFSMFGALEYIVTSCDEIIPVYRKCYNYSAFLQQQCKYIIN